MSEEPKKIEVVTGDGTDLTISPVYEHLNVARPKAKEENKKKIVIPQVKKQELKDDENNDNNKEY